MSGRLRSTYNEFPRRFWVLVAATFIDVVGESALFPFFALYVTSRFEVGMATAGVLFGIVSLSGLFGGMIGGALADRFGRRGVCIFGLVFSALSALALGFVGRLSLLYWVAVPIGLLTRIAGPAYHAMVADLVPEDKRTEGFGILRVGVNLAWMVGPSIGGFLAARSFLTLFVLDAAISLLTAGIVFLALPETRRAHPVKEEQSGLLHSLAGYGLVAADRVFLGFVGASMLMWGAYQQVNTTLSVFLRDARSVSAQGYGLLMSINATTVVLLQFWITGKVKARPPALMMAFGTLFFLLGFIMFGWVVPYSLMIAAMLLLTFGEMIVVPVGQALVARLSPEDMRGRYAAFYGLASSVPSVVAPWAGGTILDRYNPNWLWYWAAAACALAALGFLTLHQRSRQRLASPAGFTA